MEDSINVQVGRMLEHFSTLEDQAFDPNKSMDIFIVNAMWSIICGETLDAGSEESQAIVNVVDGFMK